MNDAARAEWTPLCRIADLTPGSPLGLRIGHTGEDAGPVCVIAHDGGPVALLDRCPHRDVALSGGIIRDGELVCPGHFWRFDLSSGQRVDDPASVLTRYDTRVVDGWVEALIPPAAPRRSMRDWLLAEAALRDERAGP